MKIHRVVANPRKARLELSVRSGRIYPVPYAMLDPRPTARNRVEKVWVDAELGREAATYVLESGEEGSVHIDHALEYDEDPSILSELLSHKLTVESRRRMARSGLSRREVARRLHTSVPQLYRLLDPTNTRKSLGQIVALLRILGCEVDVTFRSRTAARAATG